MEYLVLLIAVVLTTVCAYLIMRSKADHERTMLQALGEAMECVGIFVVFLAANVSLGVAVVLLVRTLTSTFVSLYVISDMALILASAFQAFVFRLWWGPS